MRAVSWAAHSVAPTGQKKVAYWAVQREPHWAVPTAAMKADVLAGSTAGQRAAYWAEQMVCHWAGLRAVRKAGSWAARWAGPTAVK